MDAIASLLALDLRSVVIASVAIVALVVFVPYFKDPARLRSYPGPLLAKFSSLYLARLAYKGIVGTSVCGAHEKYGTFVRLAPNHISVAHPDALHEITGHSTGTTKSDFYDALVNFNFPSVVSTRDRAAHAYKRRIVAHSMAPKTVLEFEPIVRHHQRQLVSQWDDLCAAGEKNVAGSVGHCTWSVKDGRVWFDCLPWFNYEAFDIIGDLAFGASFGMLEAAQDTAQVATSQDAALDGYDKEDVSLQYETISAVETINQASSIGVFLGTLPPWCRPIAYWLPKIQAQSKGRHAIRTMAVTAVSKRLHSSSPRADLLSKLLDGRDGEGKPLGKRELSAESLSIIIAGSDTTSNSMAAITYFMAQNPAFQAKLQEELDRALGPPGTDSADETHITTFDEIKNVEYLQDVINEGLRLHSTIGFGLPRVVPEGGMTILGQPFSAGTVVSCPIYTLHRLKSVWGDDADFYNPDRWSQGDKTAMMRAFTPFSVGPRGCVGRNLAIMELSICLATVFHRYDIVLKSPDQPLHVHDGFLRKPMSVLVGMKRRGIRQSS